MDLVIDKLNFAKEATIEMFMGSATNQYAAKKGEWNIPLFKTHLAMAIEGPSSASGSRALGNSMDTS